MAQDYSRALELYRSAADHGNAKAQNNLGSMYAQGIESIATRPKPPNGSTKRPTRERCWRRIASARCTVWPGRNQGCLTGHPLVREAPPKREFAEAQLHLGQLYYFGEEGVEKNYPEAAKWLAGAAAQGRAPAQNYLGVIYQGRPRRHGTSPLPASFAKRRSKENPRPRATSARCLLRAMGSGAIQSRPTNGSSSARIKERRQPRCISKNFEKASLSEQIEKGNRLVEEFRAQPGSSRR